MGVLGTAAPARAQQAPPLRPGEPSAGATARSRPEPPPERAVGRPGAGVARPRPTALAGGSPDDASAAAVAGSRRRRGWWHWSYAHEWGGSAALFALAVGVQYGLTPYERGFSPDDERISKTMRSDTYPTAYLTFAAAVPLATFGLMQLGWKSWHDFHHAALGMTEAFSMTLLLTALLKATVGRLRPDFLARCQPDASLTCTGDAADVADGRRSFPSGHSSLAFTGGAFLSLYLWGRLAPYRGWSTLWKVPALAAPLVAAWLIAYSRVTDHRHHWEDVLAGSLIGTTFAAVGYFLHYHPPWSARAGQPRRRGRVIVTPVAGTRHLGVAVAGGF